MLLKTITDSKYKMYFGERILEDPETFKKIMDVSFAFRILLFIISMAFISHLFIIKPDNILWYIVPVILFVYNLKTLFEYRGYFAAFLQSYNLSYNILNVISCMTDEEVEVFLSGFSVFTKQKLLEHRRAILYDYDKN